MLNKFVLLRCLPAAFTLLVALSPCQGQTARAPAQKGARPAVAQGTKPATPARSAAPRSAYTSADGLCQTGRRRLWTESGWLVRRVTSCR